ncbi:MAG: hypothetical protein WCP55_07415, partial [Lentisphaerota bacterium]
SAGASFLQSGNRVPLLQQWIRCSRVTPLARLFCKAATECRCYSSGSVVAASLRWRVFSAKRQQSAAATAVDPL